MSSKLGFVIVRHINTEQTAQYWRESCLCIRKFYDNPILIVDDNSDSKFINVDEVLVDNCTIVKSEFHGRGEILGYYYFHKLRPFDKAVIIHDSVFLNSKIDFDSVVEFRSLWSFEHQYDNVLHILSKITHLEPCSQILRMYLAKSKWKGCFGIMAVISWTFLDRLVQRFELFDRLLPYITCREDRCSLERIFSCLVAIDFPEIVLKPHLISNIHQHGWVPPGISIKQGRLITYRLLRYGRDVKYVIIDRCTIYLCYESPETMLCRICSSSSCSCFSLLSRYS